jgi:Protein of unknown function (DUF4058)
MAGPFPGMDPYIESQGNWQDFHNRLITEMCNSLGIRLPDDYVARVDESIEVIGFGESERTVYRPDVLIARHDRPESNERSELAGSGLATVGPIMNEVIDHDPEDIRRTWIEIRRLPDLDLVTVVEVLSPVNKSWPGRPSYLAKRDDLHARRINLVEIDLLLGGQPLPMKRRLGVGHYYAIVARGPSLPTAEVYRWSVRDPLPAIPIPLRAPDPDVQIELNELVGRVYDLGRYRRTLQHDQPLPDRLSLPPGEREWAQRSTQPG